MSRVEDDMVMEDGPREHARWQRKRIMVPVVLLIILAAALFVAWSGRERIVGNVVDSQIAAYDLPVTYEIGRVTGQRQMLRDVVVGDPAAPDLTIDEVEVRLRYGFGAPEIGHVTLVNPRLFGRFLGKRVSFGSLDRVLYRESDEPPGLPDIDLTIRDGRALVRTPFGPVGAKLEGSGLVSDGFIGTLALSAPSLRREDCAARGASAFGEITTAGARPAFKGPLRVASLACTGSRLALSQANVQLDVTSDEAFSAVSGRANLATGATRIAALAMNGADGTVRGQWKGGIFDFKHTVAARGVTTNQVDAALTTLDGTVRASDAFTRIEVRSAFKSNGLRPGPGFARALASLGRTGEGTFIAPLSNRFARALAQAARGSAVSADVVLRRSGTATTLLLPQAEMRGGSGARIVALSRVEGRFEAGAAPRLTGNIATGGPDMPRIAGRMERSGPAGTVFRLTLAPYAAGTSVLAIPGLSVMQSRDGALGFSGRVRASGPLPGGFARNLALPVEGRWAPGGTLSLWQNCLKAEFDSLQFANLALSRRAVTVCPPTGRTIVESGPQGLRIAAGAPTLDLTGMLGQTPIRIASGPIGFAYPGVMSARRLAIALGPVETASRFAIANLTARLDGSTIAGAFDGSDVQLNSVPLDLQDARGSWRYANGELRLAEGDFRLVDRDPMPRFEPLIARGGTLILRDNLIRAQALLRNPTTEQVVTEVTLEHDLAAARGFADLAVPDLVFDDALQPDQLSRLARGVIANADGRIRGSGRIDWSGAGVTSTGRFSTDNLDFAAAFGPVQGARGAVVFSDLARHDHGARANLADRIRQSRHRSDRWGVLVPVAQWASAGGGGWQLALHGRAARDAQRRPEFRRVRSAALYLRYRRTGCRGIHRPIRIAEHCRDRDLRWQGPDRVRPERKRPGGGRPADVPPAGGQCQLCWRSQLQGLVHHGELRLRCATQPRLYTDAHRNGWIPDRRDRDPRRYRRRSAGRRRQAQHHNSRPGQSADPVPHQC